MGGVLFAHRRVGKVKKIPELSNFELGFLSHDFFFLKSSKILVNLLVPLFVSWDELLLWIKMVDDSLGWLVGDGGGPVRSMTILFH